MRSCKKFGCPGSPVVSVGVRYRERAIVVGDLTPEQDPNLMDLCERHAERLTAPLGWARLDQRRPAQPPAAAVPQDLSA